MVGQNSYNSEITNALETGFFNCGHVVWLWFLLTLWITQTNGWTNPHNFPWPSEDVPTSPSVHARSSKRQNLFPSSLISLSCSGQQISLDFFFLKCYIMNWGASAIVISYICSHCNIVIFQRACSNLLHSSHWINAFYLSPSRCQTDKSQNSLWKQRCPFT